MPKKLRVRSVKVLKKVVSQEFNEVCEDNTRSCIEDNTCSCIQIERDKAATVLTPELKRASAQGWNMIKSIAFPSLPALLQDLWVYTELLITIVAFILGCYGTFPIDSNEAFQYTFFVLTSISMIIALIDAYMYFIEVGSCVRDCKKNDTEYSLLKKHTCCKESIKEKFYTFFEVGRNVVTELLLYPLLIFDLFSFQLEQTYQPEDPTGVVDFSLFLIGSFYLILGVYIMRLFVMFGAMFSLLKLPLSEKTSSSSLLIKFCIHACGQIFVHLSTIVVIGAKINNENVINTSNFSINTTDESQDITVSPFLWLSIILGWLLPLAGTIAFFIVNYYWMREFTVDFWLNMVSLLQGASFAETVFGGDGFSETKEQTLEFVQKSSYRKVKKQILIFKSPSWWIKFFYPARIPLTALCGILYDLSIIAFIISLMLGLNDGRVEVVVFKDDNIFSFIFVISILITLLANAHILFLLNSLLIVLSLVLVIGASIFFFIILPLLLFVYFPVIGILGYSLLAKSLNTLSNSKKNLNDSVTLKENYFDHERNEYV